MSLFGAGTVTWVTLATFPARVSSTLAICALPGASLSPHRTTSLPRRNSLYPSSHFPAPPTLQVAHSPAATNVFASFSPSTIHTHSAASTAGSRYETRRQSLTVQIHPPLPSGLRCLKVLGSYRTDWYSIRPCSSV